MVLVALSALVFAQCKDQGSTVSAPFNYRKRNCPPHQLRVASKLPLRPKVSVACIRKRRRLDAGKPREQLQVHQSSWKASSTTSCFKLHPGGKWVLPHDIYIADPRSHPRKHRTLGFDSHPSTTTLGGCSLTGRWGCLVALQHRTNCINL